MLRILRCKRGEVLGIAYNEKASFPVSKESIQGIVNEINNLKNLNIKLFKKESSSHRGICIEYTVINLYKPLRPQILKIYKHHPIFGNMVKTLNLSPERSDKIVYDILKKYID